MYINCLLEYFVCGNFLCNLVELFGVFFPAISLAVTSEPLTVIFAVYTFIFDEVFYSFVSLCVVIHSVEFSDCCYITSYTQMINKNVLFPVDTEAYVIFLFVTHGEQLFIKGSYCQLLVIVALTTKTTFVLSLQFHDWLAPEVQWLTAPAQNSHHIKKKTACMRCLHDKFRF